MKKITYKKFLPVLAVAFLLWPMSLAAQGHFEFGFHYSSWSLDVLKSLIEDGINEVVEDSLKDEIINSILEDRPGIQEVSYAQNISFDSGGNNWGFELRWYPKGQEGSFTFGFGVADTNAVLKDSLLDISFTGTATFEGEESDVYNESVNKTLQEIKEEADAEGDDFFMPPILPFFQLNFGLKGEITPNLYILLETGIFNGFILRGGISIRL